MRGFPDLALNPSQPASFDMAARTGFGATQVKGEAELSADA
jgi:hypothetical protein